MSNSPTSSPLDGVLAKLKRAADLITSLDQQITQTTKSGQYTVPGQFHHSGRYFAFTAYGPPLPLSFSVLAGEIMHHLRSVLDHLVWQLVLANGEQPTERNEFPMSDTHVKFGEAIKRRKLNGVSAAAQARIESLQPYHATNLEASWLWVVHDLDRIDKHRLLVVLLAAMKLGQQLVLRRSSGPLTVTGMTAPKWVKLTPEGTEVFRIELGDPCPSEVYFEAEFEMVACIDRVGSVQMPSLISTLRSAFENVKSTIQSFDKEF